MKRIILCADDFGLNAGVCEGILDLVQKKRLSAVSCMTNMPDFKQYADELFSLNNQIQTGLHFNLTEGYFLSNPNQACLSLNQLLLKTHLRLIQPSLIAKELNAQLDEFIQFRGDVPDFIDGHQHSHQFPIIRDVLLKIYEERLRKKGAFIRATYPLVTLPKYRFKAQIIALTGGRALKKQLQSMDIPHNSCFSGIYDFAQGTDYRSLFRYWLSQVSSDTLIMCHPSKEHKSIDSIAHARLNEMNYFLSEAFLEDCLTYQIITRLGRSDPTIGS